MGVSMDDVAARMGATKPAIYRHFKSKEALFEALLARELTPEYLQTAQQIQDYDGPIKPLLRIALARAHPDHPNARSAMALFRLIVSDGYRVPVFAQGFYQRSVKPINAAMQAVFKRAMARGAMRKANPDFAGAGAFRALSPIGVAHDDHGSRGIRSLAGEGIHGSRPGIVLPQL